jgi:hypothetical protein
MNQIKIFKGLENDLTALEQDVNAWLAEANVRVINVLGNIAPQTMRPQAAGGGLSTTDFIPSDVLLVVVYDK